METMFCIDLLTDKMLWEKRYEGGCDRMAVSPDGKIIYLPTVEKDDWHVVDALSGDMIKKLTVRSGAHNTIYSPTGKRVYLAGTAFARLEYRRYRHSYADENGRALRQRDSTFHDQQCRDALLCERKRAFGIRGRRSPHGAVPAPGRSSRVQDGARETPQVPQPWRGADARRKRSLGGRRIQSMYPHL